MRFDKPRDDKHPSGLDRWGIGVKLGCYRSDLAADNPYVTRYKLGALQQAGIANDAIH
jgi:hypothetical protein